MGHKASDARPTERNRSGRQFEARAMSWQYLVIRIFYPIRILARP